MTPLSGDVFAQRRSTALDWLIRTVTHETWNHVGVVELDRAGRAWALQAKEGDGVERVALASIGAFDLISVGKPLSAQALAYAHAQLGKPYSYIDAALAGFDLKPIEGGNICSEYAARVLVENTVLSANWASRGVTPGELVEQLLNQGCVLGAVAN